MLATFGGGSIRGFKGSGGSLPDYDATTIYDGSSSSQTGTLDVTNYGAIKVIMWGGGGGGNQSGTSLTGGCGGYSEAIIDVTNITSLGWGIGEGGNRGPDGRAESSASQSNQGNGSAGFGNGGSGQGGGGGGGGSMVYANQGLGNKFILLAAGGGGGSAATDGGSGGSGGGANQDGQDAEAGVNQNEPQVIAEGASASGIGGGRGGDSALSNGGADGANAGSTINSYIHSTTLGTAYTGAGGTAGGGNGGSGGGGGGGGYAGGGGGGGGNGEAEGGGGGGSGYANTAYCSSIVGYTGTHKQQNPPQGSSGLWDSSQRYGRSGSAQGGNWGAIIFTTP